MASSPWQRAQMRHPYYRPARLIGGGGGLWDSAPLDASLWHVADELIVGVTSPLLHPVGIKSRPFHTALPKRSAYL